VLYFIKTRNITVINSLLRPIFTWGMQILRTKHNWELEKQRLPLL
jgi:hypothetical protein